MSYWKIAWVLGTVCSFGCAKSRAESIVLVDGKPVQQALNDGANVKFDGDDTLFITYGARKYQIKARTPTKLFSSSKSKKVAINFGSGSGQVYDLEVLDLTNGKVTTPKDMRANALAAAKAQGCEASPDQISIVFDSWVAGDTYSVRTEDFSRRDNCSQLNRRWVINVE
jgi:hypothetical protein